MVRFSIHACTLFTRGLVVLAALLKINPGSSLQLCYQWDSLCCGLENYILRHHLRSLFLPDLVLLIVAQPWLRLLHSVYGEIVAGITEAHFLIYLLWLWFFLYFAFIDLIMKALYKVYSISDIALILNYMQNRVYVYTANHVANLLTSVYLLGGLASFWFDTTLESCGLLVGKILWCFDKWRIHSHP